MRRAEVVILAIVGALAIALVLFLCFGKFHHFQHTPLMAATSARVFANRAFIKQDYKSAFANVDPGTQAKFDLDSMIATIKEMHPTSFPQEVDAVEYEPMPGQRAMAIYVVGKNGDENFYYRLVMQGETETGYLVGAFVRGRGPFPPSHLRKPLR